MHYIFRKFSSELRNAEFRTSLPSSQKIVDNVSYYDSFKPMIDKFCECIRKGAKPLSTASDAEIALRIVQSVYKSAVSGMLVEI